MFLCRAFFCQLGNWDKPSIADIIKLRKACWDVWLELITVSYLSDFGIRLFWSHACASWHLPYHLWFPEHGATGCRGWCEAVARWDGGHFRLHFVLLQGQWWWMHLLLLTWVLRPSALSNSTRTSHCLMSLRQWRYSTAMSVLFMTSRMALSSQPKVFS